MENYLGIDIGSTTVKAVLIDHNFNHLIEPIYVRSFGQPLAALRDAFLKISFSEPVVIGITGSGRNVLKEVLELPNENVITEIYAHSYGAWHEHSGVRTVIDIGGQDNKLIRLDSTNDGGFVISEFIMNELCAAGTGAFLEMHSKELGYNSIEEFSNHAAKAERASKIAGRCSVLAQSDVVHLRQSGESLDHIAAGLCRAVVLNVLSMSGGKPLLNPILFQGGVAANAGIVKALRSELRLNEIIIPKYFKTIGAIGAAQSVLKRGYKESALTLEDILKRLDSKEKIISFSKRLNVIVPEDATLPATRNICQTISPSIVVGIDAGSASMKVVALDFSGNCLFTFYRLHGGKVLDTLYDAFNEMNQYLSSLVITGVGVTGSGRDNIMLRIGADLSVDEITAQAVGAKKLVPDVESIFEIGGQDSKFIQLKNGQVKDFEMNRICAAGTGAFVVEASKILGISDKESIDEIALRSSSPLLLNNRCCVFAKSDMVSALNSGVSKPDVAAGVLYAVIKNYLNLVVGSKDVGKKVVFLGGLAKSSPATSAVLKSLRPDLDIVIPEDCDVSGAIGAAQITLEKVNFSEITSTNFRGINQSSINKPVSKFDCDGCPNICRIKKWELPKNEILYTGSICGKYEGVAKNKKYGKNYVKEDLMLLDLYNIPEKNITDETIGIPKALLYYEQGPLWVSFLRKLGLQVVVSDTGRESVKKGGLYSSGLVCLPIKVLLGHTADLIEGGVKKIFWPTVVEMNRPKDAMRSDECMLIQASSDSFLKSSFPNIQFISPTFYYDGKKPKWRDGLYNVAKEMGFHHDTIQQAIDFAVETQNDFLKKREELGVEFLKEIETGSLGVVIIGHEYSSAPELEMGLSRHFSNLGVAVAPLSIIYSLSKCEKLGEEHSDIIFKSSQKIIQAMMFLRKQKANLFSVVLNQFLCRQDACIIPFLHKFSETKPILRLVLDENVGDAGIKTRCEAFYQVMKQHIKQAEKTQEPISILNFIPVKKLKNFTGTVWMNKLIRFYAAGYNAVGINVNFFPDATTETIDNGRKYFPDGEPCLPFIREAGQLEDLIKYTEFNPDVDVIHVPGTRHCASTTLPQIYKRVCEKFGAKNVKFVSPRDGLDMAEGVEAFGPFYIQAIVRAMFIEDYLKRLQLSIRPYEAIEGETDKVLQYCMEQSYKEIGNRCNLSKTLPPIIGRFNAIELNTKDKYRPKILVTGEYVVRTDSFLNEDIHKMVESLGGEAVRTPLFSDYAEVAGKMRYKNLWKIGHPFKSIRELILSRFLIHDLKAIRRIFSPYLSGRIEPDPVLFLKTINKHLDPVMLLEFFQAQWNVEVGDIAGIINVHPFGCSISTAIEPTLYHVFGKSVPILSLSFDGQAVIHLHNRLSAFMECIQNKNI